ncbi:MAG TPA: FtsX-like permease family protein, partial [Terriglobia bacterium]|nr:FtsX-like permease family protein [Terriglobia bacterium]
RKGNIVVSFIFEAVLLALLGAAVGIILMLPFNGMSTSTANQVTFSQVVFSMRITLSVVVSAVVFAIVMGLIGGVAPAWGAARREILAALRD